MVVSQAVVQADTTRFAGLAERGVVIHAVHARDLKSVLTWLARRDIVTLLVEGGAALHTAFANAGMIDRVQWVVTPHHLGSGVPAGPISPEAFGAAGTRRPLGRLGLFGKDELIEFDVHRTG
jgi:riboflavin biosynthesis pyrimidine reductase